MFTNKSVKKVIYILINPPILECKSNIRVILYMITLLINPPILECKFTRLSPLSAIYVTYKSTHIGM